MLLSLTQPQPALLFRIYAIRCLAGTYILNLEFLEYDLSVKGEDIKQLVSGIFKCRRCSEIFFHWSAALICLLFICMG